jgi:hypothetical protein
MLTKKQLKETAEEMPEVFSLEELFDRLILLDKIGKAEIESENNDVISEEELENEIQKWFK